MFLVDSKRQKISSSETEVLPQYAERELSSMILESKKTKALFFGAFEKAPDQDEENSSAQTKEQSRDNPST